MVTQVFVIWIFQEWLQTTYKEMEEGGVASILKSFNLNCLVNT